MDGNAKHDLEHTSEKTVTVSAKTTKILTRLFGKFLIKANKFYQKHFSSSMKALRKDGATKELYVSPPLTKAEAKQVIAAARENEVLVGVQQMSPDGEKGKNKSLHKQEKLAHNEIKYQKWDKRKTNAKVKILRNFYKKKAEKYKELSLLDEQINRGRLSRNQVNCDKWVKRAKSVEKIPILKDYCKDQVTKYRYKAELEKQKNKDERYVILVNKSKVGFLNEQLEKIPPSRLKRLKEDELEDINKDGVVDERDYEVLKSRSMNLKPEELEKIGDDFGTCMVRDYKKNYCTQKITKEQYCEIREQLFSLPSHGACVLNDKEVLIAIRSEDLDTYREYAPLDRKIKEYGEFGARDIRTEKNANDVINLEIDNAKEFKAFKEKYQGKDFLAQHNENGSYDVWVREVDTKDLIEDVKKKSTTANLLEEANKFVEEQKENIPLENVLEKDEEEYAR